MRLFSRANSARRLPADIVDRVQVYIRFETDPQGSGIEPERINQLIYQPLYKFASEDPVEFTRQLADAVLPVGGLLARGGARLIPDLIGGDFENAHYFAMLDAALDWLHRSGVGSANLTGHEWNRWCATRGGDSW